MTTWTRKYVRFSAYEYSGMSTFEKVSMKTIKWWNIKKNNKKADQLRWGGGYIRISYLANEQHLNFL